MRLYCDFIYHIWYFITLTLDNFLNYFLKQCRSKLTSASKRFGCVHSQLNKTHAHISSYSHYSVIDGNYLCSSHESVKMHFVCETELHLQQRKQWPVSKLDAVCQFSVWRLLQVSLPSSSKNLITGAKGHSVLTFHPLRCQ